MPFVQGHLRHEPLTIAFRTECAHCARPMRLEVDSELQWRVAGDETDPLVCVPVVNFAKLKASNIIDDF